MELMNSHAIDQTKLNAFFARALGDLSAGYGGVMVSLGSKLGLYRGMSGAGPITPGFSHFRRPLKHLST
jgi:hypothetical protein